VEVKQTILVIQLNARVTRVISSEIRCNGDVASVLRTTRRYGERSSVWLPRLQWYPPSATRKRVLVFILPMHKIYTVY